MNDNEKVQYTKDWGARVELGQALQRNLAGAYMAALELLRIAKPGECTPNYLNQASSLMHLMGDLNRALQNMPGSLEEARDNADPDYWRKAEQLITTGMIQGPVQQSAYALTKPVETPIADFLRGKY